MKTVLHVEDRAPWLKTVKRFLESTGLYQVTSFATLADAKEAVEQQDFDYYICDRQIGAEDGGPWAQNLKVRGCKVMVLSTQPYEDVAFLDKSDFDQPSLLAKLESL